MCVEKCPTEDFAFFLSSWMAEDVFLGKMICKDGNSPNSTAEAEHMINNNTCAAYYLKSKEGESAVCTFSVKSFHKLQ